MTKYYEHSAEILEIANGEFYHGHIITFKPREHLVVAIDGKLMVSLAYDEQTDIYSTSDFTYESEGPAVKWER